MRIDDAGRACLVLVAALVACAGGAAPRPEATSTPSASSTPRGAATTETATSAAEPTSPAPVSAGAARTSAGPAPATSAEPSPTCFTRVSFDLRAMPHRGPRDVDERLVSGRVELLVQEVRDAAGEPAPRFLLYPGLSVFRAEFFGSAPEALAQCQHAVDAVATAAATDPGPRSPLAELRDVEATPCARIEPGAAP